MVRLQWDRGGIILWKGNLRYFSNTLATRPTRQLKMCFPEKTSNKVQTKNSKQNQAVTVLFRWSF